MIVKVWGIVNNHHIDFTPIPNKPDYWEGWAPRDSHVQTVEIWAENDRGARGRFKCTVILEGGTETLARLVIHPIYTSIVKDFTERLVDNNSIKVTFFGVERWNPLW